MFVISHHMSYGIILLTIIFKCNQTNLTMTSVHTQFKINPIAYICKI